MPDLDSADATDSSASDSEDSENENEAVKEAAKQLPVLKAQIDANPFDYSGHVAYISALRATGQLDNVRSARENMNARFPLAEEMWIEWINDESRLATSQQEKEAIVKLFERAVGDYLSVQLWTLYAAYLGTLVPEPPDTFASGSQLEEWSKGVERVREVFERAVTAAGLHVREGGLLWAAYRHFEERVLEVLEQRNVEGNAPVSGPYTVGKQADRVRSLFKRQLGLSLMGNDDVLEAYKKWEQEHGGKTVGVAEFEKAHTKAKAALEERAPMEERVQSSPVEALTSVWSEYGLFEEGKKEPSRVLQVYERAVKTCCLTPAIWNQYLHYVATELKNSNVSFSLAERAVRNCYWSGQLWAAYITLMERFKKPPAEVDGVLERALQAGVGVPSEVVEIFFAYIDFQRRRVQDWKAGSADPVPLRAVFERASSYVSSAFPDSNESMYAIDQLWACIEGRLLKNLEAARKLFEANLKRVRTVDVWLDYIALEREFGSENNCRQLFKRAISSAYEGYDRLTAAWILFERQCGSLDQWDQAIARIAARSIEVATRMERERQEALAAQEAELQAKAVKAAEKKERKAAKKEASRAQMGEGGRGRGRGKRGGLGYAAPARGGANKRRPDESVADERGPKKARKGEVVFFDEGSGGEQTEEKEKVDEMDVDKAAEKQSPAAVHPPADADSSIVSPPAAIPEQQLVGEQENKKTQDRHEQKQKKKAIEHAEAEAGADGNGSSGGEDVDMDQQHPSKPDEPRKEKVPGQIDPYTIIVKNLGSIITKEDLYKTFKEYGRVKDIRPVVSGMGHPRGFAYVEFFETSAASAACEMDGKAIKNRHIRVAISCPPMKRRPEADGVSGPPPAAAMKPPRPVRVAMNKQEGRRTAVSLMPRKMVAHKPMAHGVVPEKHDHSSMSNDDFKKMMSEEKK